jgi:hypothetical protein
MVTVTPKGKAPITLYAPTARQRQFHECPARNVLYGGAAGGGKSHALRWDAYMRCLSLKHYRALLLRRTYPELENTHLENVPVDLAGGLPAEYLKSERKVRFRNGAVLQFGHCEDEAAVGKYLSTEYDAIYFDELVTFTEKQFLMIRSRARSTKPGVRPMIRAGTNPGGPESHWVRRRFIWQDLTGKEDPRYRPEDYAYIPATLDDNPYIDREEYAANLESLPEELARAYRYGDWDIFPGQYFGEWRKAKHVSERSLWSMRAIFSACGPWTGATSSPGCACGSSNCLILAAGTWSTNTSSVAPSLRTWPVKSQTHQRPRREGAVHGRGHGDVDAGRDRGGVDGRDLPTQRRPARQGRQAPRRDDGSALGLAAVPPLAEGCPRRGAVADGESGVRVYRADDPGAGQ